MRQIWGEVLTHLVIGRKLHGSSTLVVVIVVVGSYGALQKIYRYSFSFVSCNWISKSIFRDTYVC